jgi:hypothetical protein
MRSVEWWVTIVWPMPHTRQPSRLARTGRRFAEGRGSSPRFAPVRPSSDPARRELNRRMDAVAAAFARVRALHRGRG